MALTAYPNLEGNDNAICTEEMQHYTWWTDICSITLVSCMAHKHYSTYDMPLLQIMNVLLEMCYTAQNQIIFLHNTPNNHNIKKCFT